MESRSFGAVIIVQRRDGVCSSMCYFVTCAVVVRKGKGSNVRSKGALLEPTISQL